MRCHFSGISLEWSLVSKDSVLVGWKAKVSQPHPSSRNYSALRHSLPGPVAFHTHMRGLIIQKKLQATHAVSFLLCYSLPCKYQLRSRSLLHLLVSPVPIPQSRKYLQAPFPFSQGSKSCIACCTMSENIRFIHVLQFSA